MYQVNRQQLLNSSLEEIWDFISTPHNLGVITPPGMDFRILSNTGETMFNGQIIEYRVTLPLLGDSRWVTEIKHVIPNQQFVDEQRIGPYKFWHHFHGLEKQEEGIKMTDRVYYLPPFGPIGSLVNRLFINKQLEEIFDYRHQVLASKFN